MVFCYCCPPAKRFDTMHSEMLFFSLHFYIVIIKLTTNCSYSNRLNLYGHCILTSHINNVFLFTELSITRCFFDPFWINSRLCVEMRNTQTCESPTNMPQEFSLQYKQHTKRLEKTGALFSYNFHGKQSESGVLIFVMHLDTLYIPCTGQHILAQVSKNNNVNTRNFLNINFLFIVCFSSFFSSFFNDHSPFLFKLKFYWNAIPASP